MKRFTAFLLALVLCLTCLIPVSANAAEFQATYTSDLGLGNFKYFFIARTSSGDYCLYCLKDKEGNISEGIQFYVSSDPKKSYLGIEGGQVSKYFGSRFSFTASTGFFSNKSALSGSYVTGWNFYNSNNSSNVILASNADIYDQDGYKIRSGDYENFLSYFTNPEQVQYVVNNYVPASKDDNGGGSGGVNIDLSEILDRLDAIINFFGGSDGGSQSIGEALIALTNTLEAVTTAVSTEIVNEVLTNIDNRLANISQMILERTLLTEYLTNIKIAVEDADTHINDYLNQINVKNGVISNTLGSILTEIQAINTTLTAFFNTDFPQGVQDIVDGVNDFKSVFSIFVTNLNNILGINFELSIRGQLNSIINSCVNISGKIGDISGKIGDISEEIGDISIEFKRMFNDDGYLQRIINAINNIPGSIKQILIDLFVPTRDDYFEEIIDMLNTKFGFVYQIIELGDVLVDNASSFKNSPPSFKLEFEDNEYLGTVTYDLVDWSKVSDYIPYVKALTSGITVYLFIRRTRKKLPEIISGGGC